MIARTNYGKLQDVLEIPDLIGIQLDSYRHFLQLDTPPEKRRNQGLQEVFREIFPIESFDKSCEVDFVTYDIGEAKTDQIECLRTGKSYCVPVYVTLKLENRKKQDTKVERVFLGDMPLMTERGTFVINGAERVIISQLHRSPGICFEKVKHSSGRILFSYRIIPDRGGWMEVQFDINDLIFIFLDRRRRRRKFLMSTFLRAMGYDSDQDLLEVMYGIQKQKVAALRKLAPQELESYYLAAALTQPDGKPLADGKGNDLGAAYDQVTPDLLEVLDAGRQSEIAVVNVAGRGYFLNCLRHDPCKNTDDALKEIYKRMRPGDPASLTNAKSLLHRLFQDQKRYDLGTVGRHKINQKLGLDFPTNVRTLQALDLVHATQHLMRLRNGEGEVDDIDHLGSRRVRTVGELLQNQFRMGLARTERLIRERMTLLDLENDEVTPSKLVNPKALAGVIRDFFGRSQLSQFMDQTNPLSELTNKRRLSALGPGGLNRERASFEVRDVHTSHYGRVCPIETPEGPNIGLISSLALYARVNEFGFIETPYRKVVNTRVTDEIVYLTADLEENYVIAQANAEVDAKGRFTGKYVMCRHKGDTREVPAEDVNLMDVSPKQLVSAASALVPFLEHDDANRALMGSNMQRQAVPLLRAETPYVGTGLEAVVARDSRAVVCAAEPGIVAAADGLQIVVTKDGKLPGPHADPRKVGVYRLKKFMRSNSSTCVNQRPIVRSGDKVAKGQVLADGTATEQGELALGRNVTVAFMPWCGYNFEDAIVVCEQLVKDDTYTSLHITEFDVVARDTKLGPEEITRDIPNVSEDALRNLDHEGVVRIGAEVKPGDILVGKITPKSETELDPEERLLRAIFGEKAADVKDTSLTIPSGTSGIVMDVEIERKADPNAAKLTKVEVRRHIHEAKSTFKAEYEELIEELAEKLSAKLLGSKLPFDIVSVKGDTTVPLLPANRKITKVLLRKLAAQQDNYKMPNCPTKVQIEEVIKPFRLRLRDCEQRRDEVVARYETGSEQEQGVIRTVRVYIASKYKVAVGDKMAGRHGNKGIVAKIVPVEDMPYLADGTAVDIVLNPLGVPSRMNVGQVLETHLGYAARILGRHLASPVFDGIQERDIRQLLREAKAHRIKTERPGWQVDRDGQTRDERQQVRRDYYVEDDGKCVVYDGRTGDRFLQRVVVGEIYMLKLDHLVVNKIHARSVGPYSLVTQQPLGGKAQHGGQRFGEMEVWALEAYGAAFTLQEMLTVKSDDVTGRTRIYESIVRGDNSLQADVPESFNVLMNEMKSLCLDIMPLKQPAK